MRSWTNSTAWYERCLGGTASLDASADAVFHQRNWQQTENGEKRGRGTKSANAAVSLYRVEGKEQRGGS